MSQWLLNRLFETNDQPVPRFAFQGTVNWMRALSLLVDGDEFSDLNIKQFYQQVKRRSVNREADTIVFENMLMAFHNQASLNRFNADISNSYDICRSAIIAWYYSIYFTCSAMVAAASGSLQETHAHTAKTWQFDIINNNLVMTPFSLSLSSLVPAKVEEEIATHRQRNVFDLNNYPTSKDEAWGAIVSYLKGTAGFEREKIENRLKQSREFKDLGVDNFRTKVARELRDSKLSNSGVNFLIQAFRYRGKANYRDSIFLSYGDDNSEKISSFCGDLMSVSNAFQRMASVYLSKRVERGTWDLFVDDLKTNSNLGTEPDYLKI